MTAVVGYTSQLTQIFDFDAHEWQIGQQCVWVWLILGQAQFNSLCPLCVKGSVSYERGHVALLVQQACSSLSVPVRGLEVSGHSLQGTCMLLVCCHAAIMLCAAVFLQLVFSSPAWWLCCIASGYASEGVLVCKAC